RGLAESLVINRRLPLEVQFGSRAFKAKDPTCSESLGQRPRSIHLNGAPAAGIAPRLRPDQPRRARQPTTLATVLLEFASTLVSPAGLTHRLTRWEDPVGEIACQSHSHDQHRVAVTEKPVTHLDGFRVCRTNQFQTGQGADQDE